MLIFDETDDLFVGDEILREFGLCTDCGLCCKVFSDLKIYPMEIKNISSILKINIEEFKNIYTGKQIDGNDDVNYFLKSLCPFLNQNKCQIYDHRFLVCRTFPLFINLTRKEAVLSGIYLCPQATQFYEGLLDFYQQHHTKLYHILTEKEQHVSLGEHGMKIIGEASLFEPYLDNLCSK